MKLINAIVSVLVVFGVTSAYAGELQADKSAPLYSCRLDGVVQGRSVAIIIGGQYISGPGRITCINRLDKKAIHYPVTIKLTGFGVGLDLSVIHSLHVVTAGIGVTDPGYFGQSFALGVSAGGSLIKAGIEFDAVVRANAQDGFGFELGFQGRDVTGLGAHLYAMQFSIEGRR